VEGGLEKGNGQTVRGTEEGAGGRNRGRGRTDGGGPEEGAVAHMVWGWGGAGKEGWRGMAAPSLSGTRRRIEGEEEK